MIEHAPAYGRLALAVALAASAIPSPTGAQGSAATGSPAALLWHAPPNGDRPAPATGADRRERSSCEASAMIAGGPAAGELGPARTRLASLLAGAAELPICGRHPLMLTARGEASMLFAPTRFGTWRAFAAVARPTAAGSIWLAYGGSAAPVERPWRIAEDSGRAPLEGSLITRDLIQEISLGASRRIGQLMLSASAGGARGVVRDETVESRTVIDSVWNDTSGWVPNAHETPGRLVTRASTAGWMTGAVNASWLRERAAFTATVGGWLPGANRRAIGWGALEVARRVQPGLWLVAGAGVSPERSRGGPPGRYSMVGLRFSYAAKGERQEAARPADDGRSFTITRASAGSYTIALRSPGARQVEITGDFSGWQAMMLAPAPGGWWVRTVRLVPGAHRMNVRIDGGSWRTPPGSTPIADDFGGSAGLVIVPDR